MAKQQSNIDTADTFGNEGGSGFFLNNVRTIGIIGIVLLVVVGGIVWYLISHGRSNDRAQVELARIRPYYDRGEFQVAIAGDSSKKINGEKIRGLRELAEDWKGVPAGKIAALFLGNSYHIITVDNERETVCAEVDFFLRRVAANHEGHSHKKLFPVVAPEWARYLRQKK